MALVQKPLEESSSPVPLVLPHPRATTTLYQTATTVSLAPQPPLLQILMSAEECQVSNSNWSPLVPYACFIPANLITSSIFSSCPNKLHERILLIDNPSYLKVTSSSATYLLFRHTNERFIKYSNVTYINMYFNAEYS